VPPPPGMCKSALHPLALALSTSKQNFKHLLLHLLPWLLEMKECQRIQTASHFVHRGSVYFILFYFLLNQLKIKKE
jgi:hypothetical protein